MKENQEIFRRALNLTLAIYRLTERFPEREFLAWQLRRLSNEVIGDLATDRFGDASKKIELLLAYFKVSGAQNWVREINWTVLRNEYQGLNNEITNHVVEERQSKEPIAKPMRGKSPESSNLMSHNIGNGFTKPSQSHRLSERQQKIIEEIQNRGSIKMADLIPLFRNQASERTIRNDLQVLLGEGLIDKKGSHRSTTYFAKQ